jgi:CheY-like chemotaxis protein
LATPGAQHVDRSRIVVVDDNVPSAELVQALLGRAGMPAVQVIHAARELLARYDELSPDLVVLDLNMPVMDGYAVLAELRSRVPAADLPILVLTADATRDATHRALGLGASDFLTKPIDAPELILRVRNLLGARALYAELRLQQRWLRASVEIGAQTLSASAADPLRTIAGQAIDIAGADVVSVGLISPDRTELMVEIAVGQHADQLEGRSFRLAEFADGLVVESGEPTLLGSASGREAPPSHLTSVIEAGPLMVLPLRGTGVTRGIISIGRAEGRRAFSSSELAMAAGFASHASVALELADARAAEHKVLLLEERDRIAIDLHEHVIQELFAIGLSLVGVAARVRHDDQLAARVRQCVEDTDRTIRKIRSSIFGLSSNLDPQRAGEPGPPISESP